MAGIYRPIIAALLAWGLAAGCALGDPPTVAFERVSSTKGRYLLWHRRPATEQDLALPFYPQGLTLESYAYRVRDRKHRSVLFYACYQCTTTRTPAEVLAFYATTFGADAPRTTDAATGVITQVIGPRDNCRLLEITPLDGVRHLKLEHVRHFAIPPRVYTPRERQVMRVLDAVTASYRQMPYLAYRMEQHVADATRSTPPSPPVIWAVTLERAAHLTASAMVNGVLVLHIGAKDGVVTVSRPSQSTTQRPYTGALTKAVLPEIDDDVALRLALGDSLITDTVDYLAICPVAGKSLDQELVVELTYPESAVTLRMRLDMQRKVLLRSQITEKSEDGTLRVLRTYTYATSTPSQPLPQQPPPAPAAETVR